MLVNLLYALFEYKVREQKLLSNPFPPHSLYMGNLNSHFDNIERFL